MATAWPGCDLRHPLRNPIRKLIDLPLVLKAQPTGTDAVRACGRPAPRAHGHMADRADREDRCQPHIRRSGSIWLYQDTRSVKPSAQPTLVRTQHLPPAVKTALLAAETRPGGPFLLVAACLIMCHRGSMHSSGYGHIADSVRAERAVRITARFCRSAPVLSRCTDAWTACLTLNAAYSGRPVLRFVLVLSGGPGGGPGPFVSAAGAGRRTGLRHPVEAAAEVVIEWP